MNIPAKHFREFLMVGGNDLERERYAWEGVHYFKADSKGVWRPHNSRGGLLNQPGFIVVMTQCRDTLVVMTRETS